MRWLVPDAPLKKFYVVGDAGKIVQISNTRWRGKWPHTGRDFLFLDLKCGTCGNSVIELINCSKRYLYALRKLKMWLGLF